jgi:hypothetical protein
VRRSCARWLRGPRVPSNPRRLTGAEKEMAAQCYCSAHLNQTGVLRAGLPCVRSNARLLQFVGSIWRRQS